MELSNRLIKAIMMSLDALTQAAGHPMPLVEELAGGEAKPTCDNLSLPGVQSLEDVFHLRLALKS